MCEFKGKIGQHNLHQFLSSVPIGLQRDAISPIHHFCKLLIMSDHLSSLCCKVYQPQWRPKDSHSPVFEARHEFEGLACLAGCQLVGF